MPASSRTHEAIASDPEWAAEAARRSLEAPDDDDEGEAWRPDQARWTELHELMATLIDVTCAANTPEDGTPWRYPRPGSLVEDKRRELIDEGRTEWLDSIT